MKTTKKIIIKKSPYDEKCTGKIVDIALEEVLKLIDKRIEMSILSDDRWDKGAVAELQMLKGEILEPK